jgi:hypothetical protein
MARNTITRLAFVLMLSFSVAACTRERRISREETSSPPPQIELLPTTTSVPGQPSAAVENTPLPAATAVPLIPSPVPDLETPPPTLSPELSGELSEIEGILNDLDQILGSTDTDVNIP